MNTTKFKLSYLLIIILLMQSCATSKINKLLNQGSVIDKTYTKTIPLIMEAGFIILPVEIKDKAYRFILDTGASSNLVSPELAKELNIETRGYTAIADFFEQEKNLSFGAIDTISIAGIDFINTTTAIQRFKDNPVWDCMDIDGFIGANLLQLSVWDIDFPAKTITFSSDESLLDLPENYKEARLYIGAGGIPSITSRVNDKKVLNTTVDLGFNGTIIIADRYRKKQVKNGTIKNYVEGFGSSLTGIYGEDQAYNFYKSEVDKLEVGELIVTKDIAHTYQGAGNTLGIGFFKDFRITLNWKTKSLKMFLLKNRKSNGYITYGFDTRTKDEKLYIKAIIKGSDAYQKLELHDQVISINGQSFKEISKKRNCELYKTGLFEPTEEDLKMKILRNDQEIEIRLRKKKML